MGYHSKFTEPVEQNKDCFTSCSLRQWKWSLFTWWRTYCRGRLLHHMYMTLFISFFKKIIHASFCVHMVCKCNLIQSILLETLEYLFNHDPVKLDAWHKFNSNPIHNQGGIEISLIFGHNKVKLIFLCEYFFVINNKESLLCVMLALLPDQAGCDFTALFVGVTNVPLNRLCICRKSV